MPRGAFQALAEDDPQQIAGYRLAARLGAGGMGKVYLSHTPGGRPVAIKVIRPEFAEDPEFRRRFAQEVRAAERVQGLYTAPVIDSDTEGPQPWLATAYVSGPTLAAAVAEHGPLPVATVLLLAAGVAEALQVVHGAGIVHRDLKPSNVLLAADGPRVIDFGIARAADTTALTSSGVTVGTPAFMSPEQAAGRAVGPQSDVFALGQVAAFAALGRSAHGDGPSHAVLYRIVHEEADLTGLPAELTELVRRCLAKDPDARPSLAEVLALCNAASGTTQLRRPEDWLPGAVSTVIGGRYEAPLPAPVPPQQPPVPAAAPQYQPTAVSPSAPMPPQPPMAHQQQSAVPSHPHYAPTQAAHPVQPLQHPQPVSQPARRPKAGVILGCVAGALVLVAAAVGYFGNLDSGSTSSNSGGGKKAGASRAQATGGAKSGGKKTGSPSGAASGSAPEPTVYKNINLADGYALEFADRPLVPRHDGGYHDLDLECGSGTTCSIGTVGNELALLDQGAKGSLGACRHETRYIRQGDGITVSRLSKGRQLCVTTPDGVIALVTFEDQSPNTSASRYVTLDVTIWRDAVPATDG
ncbi:serine/threonine-protein kinase [Streptomyces sp. BK340]|uniref:serine/threonine-protein kinase n=1 Tax=Streptomyces sp. BK340 TaxID=2572903 RepID=UPI0021BD3FCE|nr:serine/threonine-protein kinase [Streptomyces sp. BK340]